MEFTNITKAQKYSEEIISKISNDLKETISNKNISIVTTGSFARGEANEFSDLDFFVIVKNNKQELPPYEQKHISDIVKQYINKDVGDTGTFGIEAIETFENLLTNLGGSKDDNAKFTRRMLFLLESKPLYNKKLYTEVKNKLINKYVDINTQKIQLTRFMLNDFIRYYRTITTDFEYKVSEEGKSWGLRNIKLTFSRKILYFAGIIAVAKTFKKSREEKIKILYELFELSPIERVQEICQGKEKEALALYDEFLAQISDQKVREKLENIQREKRKECQEYVELKEKSKKFSKKLQEILESIFDKNHPIYNALLF